MNEFILFSSTYEKWVDAIRMQMMPGARGEEVKAARYELCRRLLREGERAGFRGNLWHCLLTESLLLDENPYTLAAEGRGNPRGALTAVAVAEMNEVLNFFRIDIRQLSMGLAGVRGMEILADYVPSGRRSCYNNKVREAIQDAAAAIAQCRDGAEVLQVLDIFYRNYGVGLLGLHKAFRIGDAGERRIEPIQNVVESYLDDLIGYDEQKRQLIENTESFLRGQRANNCLLYGEAGTGKSSSIRGILHRYYDQGLRIVEVYKHQYKEINELIRSLKDRNYRFIIYMDDLSFEEFEVEYKFLKALIEGGLEERPENVLIYATSNRRHLVRESFDDRPDSPLDKHKNETVQEKLSLFSRFGITIYYGAPAQKEYFHIVEELAKRYGLPYSSEELRSLANSWELSHNGLSGRTAAQLIDHLRGQLAEDARRQLHQEQGKPLTEAPAGQQAAAAQGAPADNAAQSAQKEEVPADGAAQEAQNVNTQEG
ncbi:MAG: ATP-binding protein [Lachnospiraceae bacterium]|nr:ATP-binding protein [Lachnospiraceae bacterium]